MLKSYLSEIDVMYLQKNKMPESFTSLFDEIQSIFGSYTEEKIKADTIVGLTGSSYKYVWQCRQTKIECSIIIGSAASIFNGITLTITDIELQKKTKLENIK